VRFVQADAQVFPFEPASFDAAFSRFGVMFFADPTAAFINIRRGLRPNGRLAFVCWRALEENPLDIVPLRAAFAHLPPFAAADAAHICRLVLMQALPALAEADLKSFAAAIKEMQTVLGAYFAPLQGSHPFASRDVGAAMEVLENEGAVGVGQSSWGPTGFAFTRSHNEAKRLIDIALNDPRCRSVDIRACKGINRGADIEASAVEVMPNS